MKNFFILVCVTLLWSCLGKEMLPSNPTEHFSKSKKIIPSKTIDLGKYNILRPSRCVRFKDWYVFIDYGDNDNRIKFLSSDLSKVIVGIHDGNGPLDVIGAIELRVVEDSIYVIDSNHKKILSVDVDADALDIKVSSYGCEMWVGCMPITKERYIDKSYIDSSLFQLKDNQNNIIMRIGYPDDNKLKSMSCMAQNSIYVNTKFCVSPNKKKYAFGTSFTGIYGFGSIINQDSITLDKTLSYYSLDIQEIIEFGGDRVIPSETSMVNVSSCTGSDKYAIFSFAGYRYGEMEKYAKNLLLYTWDGEPYMCLDIEDDNVSQIYYDSIRNVIVGIAHNPDAHLVEYDMEGIIK